MPIPNSDQLDVLRDKLRPGTHVLITSHVNPDGDSIGSSLAMATLVERLGCTCEIAMHHAVPDYLKFLPGSERILAAPSREADIGIILDLNVANRVGSIWPAIEQTPYKIHIDHHLGNELTANVQMIDATASATCLILSRMFEPLGVAPSPSVATLLLAGIITDTGSFRFPNTTAETLEAASRLVAHGGDIVGVSRAIYSSRPLSGVRLQQRVLDSLKTFANDAVATAMVTMEDFEATGTTDEATEGFSGLMMSIEPVRVAALLRQERGKNVRVSIRSKPPIDISVVAAQFGGGGHANASGCVFEIPIEDAERQVREALIACLASW